MHDAILYHPTITCRSCGSHVLEVTGELKAASPARCRHCGTSHGTWQALIERSDAARKVSAFIQPFHVPAGAAQP